MECHSALEGKGQSFVGLYCVCRASTDFVGLQQIFGKAFLGYLFVISISQYYLEPRGSSCGRKIIKIRKYFDEDIRLRKM